ncbi:hypothetical protein, partial [Mycobacterium sp. E1319]|uniref:hypothetical protein n=2 Tax=unclassified Mycobacterium TaxID=2642494 RepID=UPI001E53E535
MTKRQAKPAAAWCACVSALVFAVGGVTAVLTATDAAAAQPVICFIGVNCGCTRNCNPPHTFAPGSVEAPPPP